MRFLFSLLTLPDAITGFRFPKIEMRPHTCVYICSLASSYETVSFRVIRIHPNVHEGRLLVEAATQD